MLENSGGITGYVGIISRDSRLHDSQDETEYENHSTRRDLCGAPHGEPVDAHGIWCAKNAALGDWPRDIRR